MSDFKAEVIAREDARCAALKAGDIEALGEVLANEITHIHASGRTEDRPAYLANVRDNLEFLSIERSGLAARQMGGAVVLSGPIAQKVRVRASGQIVEMAGTATQVWVQEGGRWRQAHFHIGVSPH